MTTIWSPGRSRHFLFLFKGATTPPSCKAVVRSYLRRGFFLPAGRPVADFTLFVLCCRLTDQILSKMDGLVNLQNVLVVGMTNRKELLDEALLRPGRMEVMERHAVFIFL